VGAGAAGLAMSQVLVDRGIDHVVLERNRVGHTWRTQRWDSFRLNTSAWMNAMLGPMDPGAFFTRGEVVERLAGIAASLPVREESPVEKLSAAGSGFSLKTPADEIRADTVVLANGMLNVPKIRPPHKNSHHACSSCTPGRSVLPTAFRPAAC